MPFLGPKIGSCSPVSKFDLELLLVFKLVNKLA